ncbi:MAG: S24 family peptidase [Vulcanimicrobiota bacterium]
MGWANSYIAALQRGETVSFRPRGHSMKGRIESGDLVTVAPVDPAQLRKGDIVLCKVGRSQFLHLIQARRHGQFLIGNNVGGTNGWIGASSIYGLLVSVEG